MSTYHEADTPSAPTIDTFNTAPEQEEPSPVAGSTGSPSQPRVLFQPRSLPVLPTYLTHFVSSTTRGLVMDEVEEEEFDCGQKDDDSVEDSEESNILAAAAIESRTNRQYDDDVPFTDDNAIRDLTTNVNVTKPPDDWTPPPRKDDKGEPAFDDVDNPGDWDRYYFNPTFDAKRGGLFKAYCLPTKAEVVPLKDGFRKEGGWVFYYKNWRIEDTWKSSEDGPFHDILSNIDSIPAYRSNANKDNLFPEDQKGYLDSSQARTE